MGSPIGEDRAQPDAAVEDGDGFVSRSREEAPSQAAPTISPDTGLRQRHIGSPPAQSGEELFEGVEVPSWKEQVTARALIVGALLGALFSLISHKLALSVGIVPSLNIAAGLLGFFLLTLWNRVVGLLGFTIRPFTRQENTVIQTCVIACSGLAFTGMRL